RFWLQSGTDSIAKGAHKRNFSSASYVDRLHERNVWFLLRGNMNDQKTDIPYGTLDLLVLKTLDAMGPMHGFGLARRIEQVAENLVRLNQGSIYPALLRLRQKRLIAMIWGVSENV